MFNSHNIICQKEAVCEYCDIVVMVWSGSLIRVEHSSIVQSCKKVLGILLEEILDAKSVAVSHNTKLFGFIGLERV
jgi:hypothetical protein